MHVRTKRALIVLGAFFLLLLFYQTPFMRRARTFTWDHIVSFLATRLHIGTLTVEGNVLEQLQQLQKEQISLKSQLSDYDRLKKQLGAPSIATMRAISAAVIGRPVDIFSSHFIISKGVADGVTVGSPVIFQDNILVGFITDVSQKTATVQTLFHPQTNLTAEVVSDDGEATAGARGLLQSSYYSSLTLSTIPRDIKVSTGQAVVTVASEQVPYGLFIGTVGAVSAKENEPYQSAELDVSYDAAAIDAVHVLVLP